MKAKKRAMLKAREFARKSGHSLGRWMHRGQTATARCTQSIPLGNPRKNGRPRRMQDCPMVIKIKVVEGPPKLTVPDYQNVQVFRDKNGKVDHLGDCQARPRQPVEKAI